MKKLVCFVLLGFVLGCSTDQSEIQNCENILPPPNSILLNYVDINGNQLINTLIVRDSFKMESAAGLIYVKPEPFGNPQLLSLPLDQLVSGLDYTLELSDSQADVLRLETKISEGECFTIYRVENFLFNSNPIQETDNGLYTLVRN